MADAYYFYLCETQQNRHLEKLIKQFCYTNSYTIFRQYNCLWILLLDLQSVWQNVLTHIRSPSGQYFTLITIASKILAWRCHKCGMKHVAIHSKYLIVVSVNSCVNGNYILFCNTVTHSGMSKMTLL